MSTFLVTGAAGFVGKKMTARLTMMGHKVIAVDKRPLKVLVPVPSRNRVDLIVADLKNSKALEYLLSQVDVVIHLAANISIPEGDRRPEVYIANNVVATCNLALAAARSKRVKRLVFASSAAVYGPVKSTVITEEEPCRPVSIYGGTKLAAEAFLKKLSRDRGMETVSLRYFNIYGPGQSLFASPSVIPQFTRASCLEEDILVNGDGRQSRDFVYIDDIVEATIRAATVQYLPPGEVINISSGLPTSILDVAETCCLVSKSSSSIVFRPAVLPGVMKSCGSTKKRETFLGAWELVSLAEGLNRTYEWARKKSVPAKFPRLSSPK